MTKKISLAVSALAMFAMALTPALATTGDSGLNATVRGRILLNVQQNGEAWYVYPDTLQRYYLGRPADAFNVMRNLGVGITSENLSKIKIGLTSVGTGRDSDGDGLSDNMEIAIGTNVQSADTDGDGFNDRNEIENGFSPSSNVQRPVGGDDRLAAQMSGKILLQVESHGEAWYVNPVDLKRYYLGRPEDAFAIMRELGLGITVSNLNQITIAANSNRPPQSPTPQQPGDVLGDKIYAPTTVTISGWEYAFNKQTVVLNPTQDLVVKFHNVGVRPHSLYIHDLGVGTAVAQPGETVSITLDYNDISRQVNYTIYSTYGADRSLGMEQLLVVQVFNRE